MREREKELLVEFLEGFFFLIPLFLSMLSCPWQQRECLSDICHSCKETIWSSQTWWAFHHPHQKGRRLVWEMELRHLTQTTGKNTVDANGEIMAQNRWVGPGELCMVWTVAAEHVAGMLTLFWQSKFSWVTFQGNVSSTLVWQFLLLGQFIETSTPKNLPLHACSSLYL